MFTTTHKIIIIVAVLVAALGVYWQVRGHEFVSYDDPAYVSENGRVLSGVTWENVKWAFRARHASNWHPLTWLSHMVDCQLFGADAGKHHLVNLGFHLFNTLLLFLFLNKLTGSFGQSVFAAGLFALHPLHVESVAWIAERKDVLSTFFWLATMVVYVHYAKRRSVLRYCVVVILFALGLMAKPMLVTLPFALLLVDYWLIDAGDGKRRSFGLVLGEKVLLFMLSAVSCIITLLAQQATVVPLQKLDLYGRISGAAVSYVIYLAKMVWPVNLAVFYPHMVKVPIWQAAGAVLVLGGITVLAVLGRRRFRYGVVGWLWYIGTLVPVIGIVQVGLASHANRYTYVPSIGVFIIVAWGMADILKNRRWEKAAAIGGGAVVLGALAVCTWFQAGYWKDSVTLYEHALAVTDNNPVMHNNLGVVLKEQGKVDEAVEHWEAALKIYPKYTDAIVNYGPQLCRMGQVDKAIEYYEDCLSWNEGDYRLHNNLGTALQDTGRFEKAIEHYQKALDLKKDLWQVHFNMGMIFYEQKKLEKAAGHLRQALRTNPVFSMGHAKLADVLILQGKLDEAIEHGKEFVRLEPDNAAAKKWLDVLMGRRSR